MLTLKKHITLFCLVVLLIPSVLQSLHAFHDHTHIVCSSIDEHHFHEQQVDCSLWHFQKEVFSYNYFKEPTFITYTPILFNTEQVKSVLVIDKAKKSPRAPPSLL
ncbi:hypothetical protein [Tenacibaculum sp. MAR_2009_124]|uniref:hypothetical protein n=1 Tax=Tenacibaculum sp. MAR_2009_124 TaxID=1250059 RepID=UPI00115FC941|nr:hypothetical protein [Tenacibaculum sp. MAR_2009_124]